MSHFSFLVSLHCGLSQHDMVTAILGFVTTYCDLSVGKCDVDTVTSETEFHVLEMYLLYT